MRNQLQLINIIIIIIIIITLPHYVQFNDIARETTKCRVREKIYNVSPKVCLAANVPTISFPLPKVFKFIVAQSVALRFRFVIGLDKGDVWYRYGRGECDSLKHDTFVYSFSDGVGFYNISSVKFKVQNFKEWTVICEMSEYFQQSFYVL